MYSRIVSIALTVLLVSGCASTYYANYKPSEFTEVSTPEFFEIKRPVMSQRKAESWGDVDSTQGILPGVYVSALENRDGTLYFGPGRSYFVKYSNKDTYYMREGGFWMPKVKAEAPKLFYIVNSNKVITANSIEEAEKGTTVESTTQNEGILAPKPPTTIVEGVGYGIAGAIVYAFIKSEDGHIVLVPTEVGFAEGCQLNFSQRSHRRPVLGVSNDGNQ